MEQLMMIHKMEKINNCLIPEGWTIRNWREGEETVWTRICENGLIPNYDADLEWWKNAILAEEGVDPKRDTFFVCRENDVPEATITAYVRPDGRGDIHMVAASDSIRGNNVGGIMLAFSMCKLDKEMKGDSRMTVLTTDDHRLPAIVGYLRGGFQPVEYDEGMVDRWTKVCDALNIHGIEMLTETGEPTGIIL